MVPHLYNGGCGVMHDMSIFRGNSPSQRDILQTVSFLRGSKKKQKGSYAPSKTVMIFVYPCFFPCAKEQNCAWSPVVFGLKNKIPYLYFLSICDIKEVAPPLHHKSFHFQGKSLPWWLISIEFWQVDLGSQFRFIYAPLLSLNPFLTVMPVKKWATSPSMALTKLKRGEGDGHALPSRLQVFSFPQISNY